MNNIKVIVIDDSALVRETFRKILSPYKHIQVQTAQNPYDAVQKIKQDTPDVIILDIEMPKMDGLTFLKKIMSQHPIPVIICSTFTTSGSKETMDALEYGAISIITKPKVGAKKFFEENIYEIVYNIESAYKAKEKGTFSNMKYKKYIKNIENKKEPIQRTTDKIVAIGASAGGTEAIRYILKKLPADLNAGIIIVQHMPEKFTRDFADRLNEECAIYISEAKENDNVSLGRVLIAPGGKHMEIYRSGAKYYISLNNNPPVNYNRPSVNVLFESVAKNAGKNSMGILLTGMGSDGATGLLSMNQKGAFTIVQDEQSSIVWGMPKKAWDIGAADDIYPLKDIPEIIISKMI